MSKFKNYINEATMGININDDVTPWTQLILQGKKTIETRNTPTLNAYVGKRVGIVRTSRKSKAMLVGYATIGEPKRYTTPEEFNADFEKHRVSPDSPFYNGGVKYGYPLLDVEACEPKEVTSKGIVSRKL